MNAADQRCETCGLEVERGDYGGWRHTTASAVTLIEKHKRPHRARLSAPPAIVEPVVNPIAEDEAAEALKDARHKYLIEVSKSIRHGYSMNEVQAQSDVPADPLYAAWGAVEKAAAAVSAAKVRELIAASTEYIRLWNEPKNGDSSVEQCRAIGGPLMSMEVNTEAEGRLAEARDAVMYANNCGCSECEAHVRDELTAFEEAVRASERASLRYIPPCGHQHSNGSGGDWCQLVRDHAGQHVMLDADYPSTGPHRREYYCQNPRHRLPQPVPDGEEEAG